MKKRVTVFNIFIFTLLFGLHSILRSQDQTFSLEDVNELVSISNLEISPDGQSVLFMTSKRNMEKNTYDRALIIMDIETKTQEIVGAELKGIGGAQWLPDEKVITFLADADGKRQVHTLEVDSGSLKQYTHAKNGVSRYAWSPDGKKLAYFSKDDKIGPSDAGGFNDSFEVGSADFLTVEPPRTTSVWLMNRLDAEAQRIVPEGFTVATGLTTSSLSWSNDGKALTFTKYPSAFSGDSDLGINYLYTIDTKELKTVTDNLQRESGPMFTPDDKSLVYRYPRDGFPSNMADFHEVDLTNGNISNLTKMLDRSVSDLQWTANGTLMVRAIDKEGVLGWRLKDGSVEKMPIGDLATVTTWSIAENGSMVLVGLRKEYPAEIYYKKKFSSKPEQLTTFNAFIKDKNIAKQEMLEWESSDGLRPNGVVTYPPDFDERSKYPLVLLVHGGPSASSVLGFNPIAQTMAAKGWIVFQPNYRGSTNLGNAFQSAISKDPSEGPGEDVITGVEVLRKKPFVDSDKIAVSGWSYGGWMTSWLIGRYPEVWTAAVAGAAPVDFTDMYSLNDLNRMRRHAMVESPYVGDNLKWAYANSPISNFSKIRTPTLVMSKTGDYRVTITGSYKLYGALRDNDVPVQFVAYPGPGHFPRDPVRATDVYQRWIKWLDKYLNMEKKSNSK